MKTHVLLVAHGSRNAIVPEEITDLAQALSRELNHRSVRAAFLEINQPDILTGIQKCVRAGAERIQVLPYLLTSGKHVETDIPQLVEHARQAHPSIEFELLPHFGSLQAIPKLLAKMT